MTALTAEQQSSRRSFFTGSAISLTLHTVLFLTAGMFLRGCQQGSPGEAGGEVFRDVGLFLVDGVPEGAANNGTANGAGDANITQPVVEQQPDETTTDQSIPDRQHSRVPMEAPDISTLLSNTSSDAASTDSGAANSKLPSLIGPGEMIGGSRAQSSSGAGSLIQPSEAGGAARIGGVGGPGQTTFMNISGVGKTFAYIIDTSSSMGGSRLKIAQSQLKASLRLLQPNQKFAVIFYNEYRERLTLRPQDTAAMYFATEVNKDRAAHEVDRVTSDRGTEHMPALLEAISLKPDVIYFLTDGDEPALSPGQLAEIRRVSNGITIHVIKFGDGTLSSRGPSWLERLATQCGGEYREITVSNR